MSFYESFDFSEAGIGVAKIAFSFERLYRVWGNIFCRLFPWLFFLGQGEKYTGKRLAGTQSMKIQVKSGEIPIRKNVGKILQNVDSRRLTLKWAKLAYYSTLKIQSRENTGKDLKISKTSMADRWVLVQRKKIYRPSRMWDNLITGSLDMGLHSSNISEVRNLRTSRM